MAIRKRESLEKHQDADGIGYIPFWVYLTGIIWMLLLIACLLHWPQYGDIIITAFIVIVVLVMGLGAYLEGRNKKQGQR